MMICIELLENLTNQELALFSHIDNMIGIEQSQVPRLKNSSEFWSTDRVISCISAALGITAIEGIISGTGGLISAASAWAIVKNLAKRYLGYVGAGIAIYEFGKCMGEY